MAKPPNTPAFNSQKTVDALKKYQKYNGIVQTGQLDSTTIRQMQRPRCGSPDDDSAINYKPRTRVKKWVKVKADDNNAKSNSFGFSAPTNKTTTVPKPPVDQHTTYYYRVNATTVPPKYPLEMVYAALEFAFNTWASVTNVQFIRADMFSVNANIWINFESGSFAYRSPSSPKALNRFEIWVGVWYWKYSNITIKHKEYF